jgi:hypothetical protein
METTPMKVDGERARRPALTRIRRCETCGKFWRFRIPAQAWMSCDLDCGEPYDCPTCREVWEKREAATRQRVLGRHERIRASRLRALGDGWWPARQLCGAWMLSQFAVRQLLRGPISEHLKTRLRPLAGRRQVMEFAAKEPERWV